MLLRALGVEPLTDSVDSYRHSLARVWSDRDERYSRGSGSSD